jgi:O-antigen/teichoic acid export membrane protein
MLGKQATGYYGLGTSIVSTLILIPMVINRVLYPRVNEEVGKSADYNSLLKYVMIPAQLLSLILPFLIGVIVFIIPDFYHYLFPKYLQGAKSAQMLVLGAYFVCLIRSGVNYLVAIDKQNKVFLFVLVSLLSNIGISIVLVKCGFNIEGISVSTALSGFIFATLLWISVFRQFGYSRRKQFSELFLLYFPFIILLAISGMMYASSSFVQRYFHGLTNVIFAVLFIIIYCLIAVTVPPLKSWYKVMRLKVTENLARK